ncbi:hypothetical protein ABPG75_007570 [Micractinium tetrahymenae]
MPLQGLFTLTAVRQHRMAAPAQRPGWQSLPEELQVAILLRLNPAERREVASVCRHWEQVLRAQQQRLWAHLTGEEELEDVAALLSGVARRSTQLRELRAEIEEPEGWAPLALLLSRLESTALQRLHVYGKSCTGGLPTCVAHHLRGLRHLHLDGLVKAPPDSSLYELTALTSLKLCGFGNELDEAPWRPMMDLPESLAELRRLHRISLHGSDRTSAPLPYTPLRHWMRLHNADVLGELPALACAEFIGFVVQDLDWLQVLHAVTRLSLFTLRHSSPELDDDIDPPHFNVQSFSTALQPLTQLRQLDLQNCGLAELPASVAALSSLRVLNLSYNPLEILPSGPYQRSVEVLQLNYIPVSGLRRVASVLQGMPQLAVLGSDHKYTAEAQLYDAVLAFLLARLPALRKLHLSQYGTEARAEWVRASFPALEVRREQLRTEELPFEGEEEEAAQAEGM